jgi:hypothetical protein
VTTVSKFNWTFTVGFVAEARGMSVAPGSALLMAVVVLRAAVVFLVPLVAYKCAQRDNQKRIASRQEYS